MVPAWHGRYAGDATKLRQQFSAPRGHPAALRVQAALAIKPRWASTASRLLYGPTVRGGSRFNFLHRFTVNTDRSISWAMSSSRSASGKPLAVVGHAPVALAVARSEEAATPNGPPLM